MATIDSNFVGTVSEYELHDFIAGMSHLDVLGESWISEIRLVIDDPEYIGEELRAEMERRTNELLQRVAELDCWLHDVAEHTC